MRGNGTSASSFNPIVALIEQREDQTVLGNFVGRPPDISREEQSLTVQRKRVELDAMLCRESGGRRRESRRRRVPEHSPGVFTTPEGTAEEEVGERKNESENRELRGIRRSEPVSILRPASRVRFDVRTRDHEGLSWGDSAGNKAEESSRIADEGDDADAFGGNFD